MILPTMRINLLIGAGHSKKLQEKNTDLDIE